MKRRYNILKEGFLTFPNSRTGANNDFVITSSLSHIKRFGENLPERDALISIRARQSAIRFLIEFLTAGNIIEKIRYYRKPFSKQKTMFRSFIQTVHPVSVSIKTLILMIAGGFGVASLVAAIPFLYLRKHVKSKLAKGLLFIALLPLGIAVSAIVCSLLAIPAALVLAATVIRDVINYLSLPLHIIGFLHKSRLPQIPVVEKLAKVKENVADAEKLLPKDLHTTDLEFIEYRQEDICELITLVRHINAQYEQYDTPDNNKRADFVASYRERLFAKVLEEYPLDLQQDICTVVKSWPFAKVKDVTMQVPKVLLLAIRNYLYMASDIQSLGKHHRTERSYMRIIASIGAVNDVNNTAPVAMLPDEILSKIFGMALGERDLDPAQRRQKLMKDIETAPSSGSEDAVDLTLFGGGTKKVSLDKYVEYRALSTVEDPSEALQLYSALPR